MSAETGVLVAWRQMLEERARQSVDALARVPGVRGLVLCGSIGRDEAWPLSDVDIIPIYEDGQAVQAARAVEATRIELLDWWVDEGAFTSLDVGKLAFTRSEVEQALVAAPRDAIQYLDDPRWFHSFDKGFRGRAAFDPEGLAAALALWLTEARFTPEMVRERRERHWRETLKHYGQAVAALNAEVALQAAISLRESLHALTRYLIERWGGRDTSFARFGTHFERTAAKRGAGEVATRIMALYGLTHDEIVRRMTLAPEGLRQRHRLSLVARRLVREPVTVEQDARDVLLVFSTTKIRRGMPPFDEWVGLVDDPAVLASQLEVYRRLLDEVQES